MATDSSDKVHKAARRRGKALIEKNAIETGLWMLSDQNIRLDPETREAFEKTPEERRTDALIVLTGAAKKIEAINF